MQAFLVCSDRKAQRIRIAWKRLNGIDVEWFINEKQYFKQGKSEGKQKKTVTFAGIPNDPLPCDAQLEVDEAQFFVTPFAITTPCRLSPATAELSATHNYVRKMLETSVFAGSGLQLCGLTIDMLKDVRGKWYFLSIDSYQLEERATALPPSLSSRSKPQSRGSCPTTRNTSPTSEALNPPATSRPKLQRKSTAEVRRTPTRSVERRMRHLSEPCFQYILKKPGLITDRRDWEKAREMEANIAGLVDLKSDKVLSHMTYRRWRERLEMKLGAGTIDYLYAKKIAGKAKEVRKEVSGHQQHLVSLKNQMIDLVAVSSVAPDQVAKAAGKLLLERVSLSKNTTAALTTVQEKIFKRYKSTQSQLASDRSMRSLLNYAEQKIDYLKKMSETERKRLSALEDDEG